MQNIWKCHGNIQHLQKNGGIGAYLFQRFVLLFVNVSSICLGKDFAPLRCTGIVEAPQGPWMGYDCCVLTGRAHLTDSMVFVCICSSVLWPNCGKHLTSSLVLHFFAAARMKVESISQALCSCTCLWKLPREKHLRITPCLSHPAITSAHPYIQTIHLETGLLLCLTLELDFWLSFGHRPGYPSGPRQKNRKCTRYQKETVPCCVWLAPHDYRLARNDFHNGGFAESAKKFTPCKKLCKASIRTALDGEIFWLSVFAKGQLHDISKISLSRRFWLSHRNDSYI